MRPLVILVLLGPALLQGQGTNQIPARQVVEQINWARQHPKAVAEVLRGWLPLFQGNHFLAFPGEPMLETQEGPAAVSEAIAFLERQTPVPEVEWSDRLRKAAEVLARDQSLHGGVGHEGSDGSSPWARIARFGSITGSVGEVATYGTFGTPGDPRRAVLALIVDDGVADRGHRELIFDPTFTLAGAAWNTHPLYRRLVVVDFAHGFLEEPREGPRPLPDPAHKNR